MKLNLKMAASLANRAGVDRTVNILRLSSNFLRGFNTTPSSLFSQNPSSASSSESKKSKRKKKKNLFEVAQFLRNWGIGYRMAKTHWVGVSYQITKINLYKDGKHGKAWGVVHKEGLPAADPPKKISGVHKRCWRYIPNSNKLTASDPSTSMPIEKAPTAEVQTV